MYTSDLLLVLGLVMVIQYFVRVPSGVLSVVKADRSMTTAGGQNPDHG
ncbi:MAG: hypothetical protein WAW37_16920 [Syntrophobacteraceae bacterium]